MKKFLLLLSMGFALLAEPLSSNVQLLKAQAEDNVPVTSHEVDPIIFDHGAWQRGETNPQEWTPDSLDRNAEAESVEQLNWSVNSFYRLNCDDVFDVFSSFIDDSTEYVVNNEQTISFLKISDSYVSAYYMHSTPILYFDQTLSGKQNISFYLDPSIFNKSTIDWLKASKPTLEGDLPLLIINDEYTFLKVEFTATGWILKTENYARVDMCKREPFYTDESSPCLTMKITIPYLDSITDIKVMNFTSLPDNSTAKSFVPSSSLFFAMDNTLHNRYYFYLFDICSLSILNKELIVDNSTYFAYRDPNGFEHDDMMASLVSMKVLFTGTKKEKNTAIKKREGITSNPFIYTPILPKEINLTFDPNIGYADGKIRCWFFDEFNLEENTSGQFKILSITFHPYMKDSTNHYRVFENITLTHHYESVNHHKYSFDVDKGIRIYYYKMTSYYRYYDDAGEWYDHIYGWAVNMFRSFHCFGFSFYFDKARRNPIPNVKKLTFKYQCGYKEPNPDPNSNGFYPNGDDEEKNIQIRTMEVEENKVRRTGALDDQGMCLTNNATKKMMTDDNGVTYDYVLYKWRKRGKGPGITTMDALEITYETKPGELVRMVGNSKGLHVVVDDDGVARVYNSEGNLEEDYGVYESQDGSLVPGKDENGDGKIDSDEVVNSDTGIKSYAPYVNNPSGLSDFINSIGDFFAKNKARTISTLVVIALIVVGVVIVYKSFTKKRRKS